MFPTINGNRDLTFGDRVDMKHFAPEKKKKCLENNSLFNKKLENFFEKNLTHGFYKDTKVKNREIFNLKKLIERLSSKNYICIDRKKSYKIFFNSLEY